MKFFLTFPIVASLLTVPLFAADLTGKIKLEGPPPSEKEIALSPDCQALHSAKLTTTHFVTDGKGGLGNVFVHIKDGLGGKKFPAPTTPLLLDQKNCVYNPYVIGVQVGQPLTIQNSDAFMHNVHAVPAKQDGALLNSTPMGGRDNVSQPNKGMKNEAKFDKPEIFVKFKCDVHPWMLAYVAVVDHPFFAVSAPDGSFKLANLPDGDYTLAAVHPKLGEQTLKIKVVGGKADPIAEIKFSPPKS